MVSEFEPLAYKVAEANAKRQQLRATASAQGVTVEVDADGRPTALTMSDAPAYLSREQLAECILECFHAAAEAIKPAVAEAMRPVTEDPLAARVATFADAALTLDPSEKSQHLLSEEELEQEQARRILHQLRNR